jgi:DNA-binding transcriptional regulator YhcF (GntR family)
MPPLYETAKAHVENLINSDLYTEGEVLPALDSLAEGAGCSTETMRRAIKELARKGTVRPIQRKGTVVVRRPAKARACLLPAEDAHTNALLLSHIASSAEKAGIDLEVAPNLLGSERLANWFYRLTRDVNPPECLILLGPRYFLCSAGEEFAGILGNFRHTICATLNELPVELPLDTVEVLPDYRLMARVAMEHFLSRGHKRVAVCRGIEPPSPFSPHPQLCAECSAIMEQVGGVCHGYAWEQGPGMLPELIEQRGVTAVWELSDYRALQALVYLTREGYDVPGEVAVMGTCDTPWSKEFSPSISTVSVNPEGFGRAVGQIVDDIVENRPVPCQVRSVSPYVVHREST